MRKSNLELTEAPNLCKRMSETLDINPPAGTVKLIVS